MLPARLDGFGGCFSWGLFLQLGPQGQWLGLHIWPLVWQRHPCAFLLPALVPNCLRVHVLVWAHPQQGFLICLLLVIFQAPASWELLLGILIGGVGAGVVISDDDEIASFRAFAFFFL